MTTSLTEPAPPDEVLDEVARISAYGVHELVRALQRFRFVLAPAAINMCIDDNFIPNNHECVKVWSGDPAFKIKSLSKHFPLRELFAAEDTYLVQSYESRLNVSRMQPNATEFACQADCTFITP